MMLEQNLISVDNELIPLRRLLINNIRWYFVAREFENNQGKRALILIPQFPFLVIGRIVKVVSDFVFVDVETTHISELEGKVLRIHLDDIEVFHIEEKNSPIPRITDTQLDPVSLTKRG